MRRNKSLEEEILDKEWKAVKETKARLECQLERIKRGKIKTYYDICTGRVDITYLQTDSLFNWFEDHDRQRNELKELEEREA